MRPDMAKVVTERPRRGHSNKSKKTGRTLSKDEIHDMADEDLDSGPNRAKVSRRGQYGWEAKDFSDLLGPLRGYLRKQVGRPWNDVHSELCQHLDKRSLSGQHIWDHVSWEVDQDAYMDHGRVMHKPRWGFIRPVEGLYVHPVSRILCWAPKRRYRYRKTPDPNLRKLTPTSEHRRIDGIWYLLHYAFQTVAVPWFNPNTKQIEWRERQELKVISKHQLSTAALRQAGLKNSPAVPAISRRQQRRLR